MARKSKHEVVSSVNEVVEEVVEAKAKLVDELVAQDGLSSAEATEMVEVAEVLSASPLLTQALAQLQNPAIEETVDKPKVERNEGVGAFIRKLIKEGMANKDILKIVHEQYGNTKTTYACVAWYRNKMNKQGVEIKKASNVEWLQNFAKANNLSEQAVEELTSKVA